MSTTGFWIDAMCHCTATSLADVKDRFREPPPQSRRSPFSQDRQGADV